MIRDGAPLTARVGSLARRALVACPREATVAEAARRMADSDTASVVFLDGPGRPVGILTDSDLRRRVVAAGLDPSTGVERVMTTPVITIGDHEIGLQAIETMLARRIHHLVVVDGLGRASGVLADSDLVAAEASGPLFLARRIERAAGVAELADARRSYSDAVRALVEAGASPLAIGRIVAEANDRLQRRLLHLAHTELDLREGRLCWLVMGSEGRRIQTLVTDQDNGIVAAGDADPAALARLAAWMVDALERCGAPRCKGDVMATNPLWRGTLDDWRGRFARWFAEPDPLPLLRALIAFDFRGVAGDIGLAEELRAWVSVHSPNARLLHVHLARQLASRRVPLGPLHGIRTDPEGGFDAKMGAIGIVVDGARLLALELGLRETGTAERLDAASARGVLPPADAREIGLAYEAVHSMRLQAQLDTPAGREPDNRIMTRRLAPAERAALKEHLLAIARFQRGVVERYGLAARG
ncbi:MAG TPA: DUF294 nucleotidyltransferase-like domain-containing protein [Candidatus Limnocylindria bacterium]|nr:DUF294 nucleotidyltransferase-like domain-containing protein [Candidatus Limnocylindria bacterium]